MGASRPAVPGGFAASVIALPAGSYDIYITEFGETDLLAGPIPLDVELGAVVGGMIFDTIDPAVLELNFLPNNP